MYTTQICHHTRLLQAGSFTNCTCLALVTGVGGYVLARAEIVGLSCTFLYFCGCWGGWWCARVYERAHTQTQALWVLDVSPGADGHLKTLVTH